MGEEEPSRRKDLLGDMTQGTEDGKGLKGFPPTGEQPESKTTYVKFHSFKALDLTGLAADSNLPEDKASTRVYACAHGSTSCHPSR